ncbi:hypothetical protein MKJ01_00270 [Chryseobacterium sp. SSA4.19]|uniref:hypothetical protein n=1 Tax=Chryseobacterium sp. SSA4.19 TaxID=2919915 RepID=UPI001F4E7D53|nr:hypothetical protein [Chryseobacterium sp. SSA4.19]MCJ8152194.1 hypothetical protein [Chryseobacterium sp. SSA4.19]
MAQTIDHANHNRDACKELRKGSKYHDWCVTTAFYSALHYVNLKIFPFNLSHSVTCNTISEAQKALKTRDLHETRAKMVELQCRDIAIQYRWLKSQAHNARYVTYKFTPTQADKAVQMLDEIEKYCS